MLFLRGGPYPSSFPQIIDRISSALLAKQAGLFHFAQVSGNALVRGKGQVDIFVDAPRGAGAMTTNRSAQSRASSNRVGDQGSRSSAVSFHSFQHKALHFFYAASQRGERAEPGFNTNQNYIRESVWQQSTGPMRDHVAAMHDNS